MVVEDLLAADVGVTNMKKHNMKTHKKISTGLAAASCALFSVANAPVHAEGEADLNGWDVKSALLLYSENEGRVQAAEPVIEGTKWLDTDESVTVKLVLDTLTGASANGAVPTDFVQTFTRPSGNGDYQTDAGEIPLDDTFRDTRVAISGAWDKPLSRFNKVNLSANVSREYDYLSFSTSALFSHDMNDKNTTLSAGLSLAYDTIAPEGNIPTPFSEMQDPGTPKSSIGDSDTKTTTDVLLGITQVIDRNSLMQFNYSLSMSDGYHTDPFKVISVLEADGRPEILAGSSYNLSRVLYENRPDERQKQSLYGQYKRYFTGDVLDTSYRYLWDDWGLKSHTVDVRYRFTMNDNNYWQPHVRYYQQSAVDFYTPFLLNTDVDALLSPDYATADYRLGDFDAYTLGLEYGHKQWKFSAEFYQQTGDEPDGKFGELNNQELATDLTAFMLRVNYDF